MIRVGSVKSSNPATIPLQDDVEDVFISPFMKDVNQNEIITVPQKEPSRKAKVYLVEHETGMTNRSYVYCSACQHRSLKLFRNVYRTDAPNHLKHCGSSDNDLLRFCRACWNNENAAADSRGGAPGRMTVTRPEFERASLGLTDKRACFAWRFIQRDFAKRKFENRNVEPNLQSDGRVNDNRNLTPLAVVIGQEGSGFFERNDSANLFCSNGKECSAGSRTLCNNESSTIASNDKLRNECIEQSDKEKQLLKILTQIRMDHDYAPTIQKEIEIATTGGSPAKRVDQVLMKIQKQKENRSKQRKDPLKIDQNKEHVKNFANKLLKKAAVYESSTKVTTKDSEMKLHVPIHKVEQELKTKRKNGEVIHPSHLVGLKATTENGETLPGLICPLCGKHTVKSYSVWRKDNAPEKILHLFQDEINVIRACRKCVPYPINREKVKRKSWSESNKNRTNCRIPSTHGKKSLTTFGEDVNKNDIIKNTKTTHNTLHNRKRKADRLEGSSHDTLKVKHEEASNTTKLDSPKSKTVLSKVKGDTAVSKEAEVRLTRVRLLNAEAASFICNEKYESVTKRAKLDEEKRKNELASRQDLTGLECFELLPSEESIQSSTHLRIISRDRTNDDNNLNHVNGSNSSFTQRGRPSKTPLECSKCSSALDRSYKSMTISKCPKKLVYLFDAIPGRRTLRLCKTCCQ